jgi:hypothetical protein
MFAYVNNLLCYYDTRCHNETQCVIIHCVVCDVAAYLFWLLAAETCSSGLMSFKTNVYLPVCTSFWSYERK